MYITATDRAHEQLPESVRETQLRQDDDEADAIRNAFETEFHMTGVPAYLEYYQL